MGIRLKLIEEFNKIWIASGIDALILPPSSVPGIRHGDAVVSQIQFFYSYMFNYFDYTAGVVPVRRVHADELDYPHYYDLLDKVARASVALSENLPIGI